MSMRTNLGILIRFWSLAGDNRRMFKISFVLMFFTLATELARPYVLEAALSHITQGRIDDLQDAAYVFLALILVDYVTRGGFGYAFSMALLKSINLIRGKVFDHVIHMKMAFFDRRPVGSLLTRTINDCEALAETLRAGAATIILDFLTVIGIFFVMCTLDLELSLAMILAAPVIWLCVRWCAKALRNKFLDVRKALAESNGYMTEGIMGVEILQLFQREEGSASQFSNINRKYCRATIHSNFYDALLYAFIDGIAACVTALILGVALNIRFDPQAVVGQVGTLIVYIRMIEKIFIPIREFSGKYATIQQGIAAIERILDLLDTPARIEQGEGRLSGDRLTIEFNRVGFRYSHDGPRVLDEISFKVRPGQSLALVGETGSGKSTIGKLLTRAYDGYEGDILVDGREIRGLNYHSLRANIAMVHQDVELFPGTLRDNITMFDPSISEEAIMNAIRMVKAEHMVAQLPDGLDFNVHESGTNLSTGQVQLIVFARALAHDVPIVLMDEATASVDSVTEAWIQEAIAQILKVKTTIIVAHRLSTIAAADHILVLKNGKITEQGNHEQLVSIENGYYSNLIRASRLQHGTAHGVVL
ncbi:MAG: ABC transporter ATP-binding protein [Acidobacteriota bacterium]|nr:ABC transporter ATP-binding protein [Acidobacteriota bacterium]